VRSAIVQAEDEAKLSRIGIWAREYQKPWVFRQERRARSAVRSMT
jgi:endonuclease YncB( thermonuclease family)